MFKLNIVCLWVKERNISMICQAIWSLQNILGGGNLLSNLRYLTIPEEVGIGRLVNRQQCVLIAGGLLVLMNSDHH